METAPVHAQALEERIYQLLVDRLGKDWDDIWRSFFIAFQKAPLCKDFLMDIIFSLVTREVIVEEIQGDRIVRDQNLRELVNIRLEFGDMYVDPKTNQLRMIGMSLEGNEQETQNDKEEIVRQISEQTFLCKSYDGMWYNIRYDFAPQEHHFEDEAHFGHFEYLRRNLVEFGYTRKALTENSLTHFGLENDKW